MALSQGTIDALKSHLKERKVPPSLRAKLFGDVLGVEKDKEQGTFKFSETKEGRDRAAGRTVSKDTASKTKELMKASQDTGSFEEYIKKGGQ